ADRVDELKIISTEHLEAILLNPCDIHALLTRHTLRNLKAAAIHHTSTRGHLRVDALRDAIGVRLKIREGSRSLTLAGIDAQLHAAITVFSVASPKRKAARLLVSKCKGRAILVNHTFVRRLADALRGGTGDKLTDFTERRPHTRRVTNQSSRVLGQYGLFGEMTQKA